MCLKRHHLGLLTAILLATPLAGCKTDQKTSEPVAEPPKETPKPETPAQSSLTPAGVPDGLSLFGDRPDYEVVPYENRLVTNLMRHSDTAEGLDFDPDICNLDDTLAYASTRNSIRPDIFLKKADGATITQLTSDPADDVHPRFSPDGLQVIFCSNRAGNWDIWLVNRDGTELIQLTSDLTDEVAPCWAPDGSQIAFTIWGARSHQWEIWTTNVDNPATRQFLVYGMFPTWSPDGKKLAFQRARQRGSRLFSVWTVDLTAGEARRPTEIAHSNVDACIAPRWSPDGSAIVYCAVRGSEREVTSEPDATPQADLWVVELKTGLRMKLTDGADAAFNPVWASSGRVFFVSPRSGTENIWSLTTQLGSYAQGPPAPTPPLAASSVTAVTEKD